MALPAVAMGLAHLLSVKAATRRRGLWVLLLLVAAPVALPVYFALDVCDELELESNEPGNHLPLRGFDAALTVLFALVILVAAARIRAAHVPRISDWLVVANSIARILCAPVFLAWFFRAHRNIGAARLEGVQANHGPARPIAFRRKALGRRSAMGVQSSAHSRRRTRPNPHLILTVPLAWGASIWCSSRPTDATETRPRHDPDYRLGTYRHRSGL